jgi:hypothetical protein
MPKPFLAVLMLFSLVISGAEPIPAQDQFKFFYGKVVDQESRRPIANVNLSLKGSKAGTVSGKNGEFSFFADSLPAVLMVSHIGYTTKQILLDETSYSLTIYLAPAVKELPEVEIVATVNEPFFKDEHYAVRDYEIDSGLVYILVFRTRLLNSEVVCLSSNGDTLAKSGMLRFMPIRLFRDCLGNMHVLSSDSGFQVYRDSSSLHLIHPVALKKFDDVLKNCVASTAESFYFRKTVDHGLSVEYFGINRKTMARYSITRVKDEAKLKMLRRNSDDAQLLWMARPPNDRDEFVNWNYAQKILYRPIKTAFYRVGSYFCVFNTPDRQMEFYDMEGNYSYKLALRTDSVNDGRWTGEVYIDESNSAVFTSFLRNGICSIYRIDLNTGILHKRVSIQHPFPVKIRVSKGFAYYMYDIPGSPDNKMLFRQRL